ncbi:CDP-alcohol phosphatidyltransferase family protein [Nocardioides renjunii]|uniref:CDP-alcohol phosphatidyltransferase family protein n=1 Tax=Nocardioides renjunii TaxID=3095075 RepID=UPI002AFE0C1C|nr:CDP-alcohol phosphatidyltransferase family protein [Nocardioides sp. S-34]WQQ21500.1 CDP-alcohol phosphatidyltransferase family protein [Nocardioides sp. S-34]
MASRRQPLWIAASWLVHAYTASGLVLAFLTVIAVMEGDTIRGLWLFLAAMVVDGTDGMLARWVQVKRHVPWFDGALLDNIVDYITYAFMPMVLLWSAGFLGEGVSATVLAVIPLLASGYQFCRVDAKTDDHLFLGFPSYWNIAAFYVVVLDLRPATVAVVLLVCAVLVFVPIGYVYPSRTATLQTPTLVLTTLWLASYAVLLTQVPDPGVVWLTISIAYVVYYVVLSLYLTARRGRTAAATG